MAHEKLHSLISSLDHEALTITKTLYVDGNRSDVYTEDGSIIRPYKVIQAAIDIASAGDLIIICPGTYTESLTIDIGVYLQGSIKFAVYITGKVICSFVGTSIFENIVLQNTADTVIDFGGATQENLTLRRCSVNQSGTSSNHCIYYSNTNANSKIRFVECTLNVDISTGGSRVIKSAIGSGGSIGLENVSVRIADVINNPAIELNGAVAFSHVQDEVKGQILVNNTCSCTLGMLSLYTTNQPVIITNSSGLTGISNCVISTTSVLTVSGAGLFGYAGIGYLSSGEAFAATLNAGGGAIALRIASASNITYDHTISGLTAINVKTAIDELDSLINFSVYRQDAEPVLTITDQKAIWVDTDDNDRTYLLFRRGSGDNVSVELT